VDCGIGTSTPPADQGKSELIDATAESTSTTFSQHRVLIFCQMKQMLDIIETDLFKQHMPSVTYMRLDGQTESSKRHAVVQTFNSDPSIDCLLLTTHVGGLGLTLTGADTVIFVEHDWNPMKDLQAMDRAHRIGQKKVVNVYRLITKGTLEEKIMGYVPSSHVVSYGGSYLRFTVCSALSSTLQIPSLLSRTRDLRPWIQIWY
jgi:TATA-binding protein-associated factor